MLGLGQNGYWVNFSLPGPRVHMGTFEAVIKEGRKAGGCKMVQLEGVLSGKHEGCVKNGFSNLTKEKLSQE